MTSFFRTACLSGLQTILVLHCFLAPAQAGSLHVQKVQVGGPDTRYSDTPVFTKDGNSLVMGSFDGNVYFFKLDGTLGPIFHAGGYINGKVQSFSDGTLGVSSSDGKIYFLHPDGTERAHFEMNQEFPSQAVQTVVGMAGDQMVVSKIGGSEQRPVLFLSSDGMLERSLNLGEQLASAPFSLEDGTTVLGTSSRILRYGQQGDLKTTFDAGVWFSQPVFLPNGGVASASLGAAYFTNRDGTRLREILPQDGDEFRSSPLLAHDGTVVFQSSSGRVHFFSQSGGAQGLFSSPRGKDDIIFSDAPPLELSDGTIVSAVDRSIKRKHSDSYLKSVTFFPLDSRGQAIVGKNPLVFKSGASLNKNSMMSIDSSTFAIQVPIPSDRGKKYGVYFIDVETFKIKAQFQTGGMVSAPLILKDGRKIFAGADGALYIVSD